MRLPKSVIAVVAGAAVMFGAVGCGGSSDSASTTPTSTAPWTKQQAGKEYLKAVARYNRFSVAWEGNPITQDNVVEYSRGLIRFEDGLARALAVGQWPTDVKPVVTRMIRNLSVSRVRWMYVVSADSPGAAWAAWLAQDAVGADGRHAPNDTASDNRASADAAQIRVMLGLPGVKP